MLYCNYKFIINKDGLEMADTEPDEMIHIENTGLQEGDCFVLKTGDDGQIIFEKIVLDS